MEWRDHLNIKLTCSNPEIFITSQWQLNQDRPSKIYLLLRIIIFISFATITTFSYILIADDGKRTWLIYMTNWGLTICTLQSLIALIMILFTVISIQISDKPYASVAVLKLYWLYWMFNIVATTMAFIITLIYWSLIYQTGVWSTMNFMVHGMNSILMFSDLCIVAHPIRILHFIYPVAFAIIYLTFTGIYYACGGLASDGSPYIYPILKWDDIGFTYKYVLLVLALVVIIHIMTWVVQMIRKKVAKLRYNSYMRNTTFIYY
ncbi:protein rolling stone-like isoform X2 [Euwallacea similis]